MLTAVSGAARRSRAHDSIHRTLPATAALLALVVGSIWLVPSQP